MFIFRPSRGSHECIPASLFEFWPQVTTFSLRLVTIYIGKCLGLKTSKEWSIILTILRIYKFGVWDGLLGWFSPLVLVLAE